MVVCKARRGAQRCQAEAKEGEEEGAERRTKAEEGRGEAAEAEGTKEAAARRRGREEGEDGNVGGK